MPQPKRFDPSIPPPLAKRRCPMCGLPMPLSMIEPTVEGRDLHTFECSTCAYAETVTVKFR